MNDFMELSDAEIDLVAGGRIASRVFEYTFVKLVEWAGKELVSGRVDYSNYVSESFARGYIDGA